MNVSKIYEKGRIKTTAKAPIKKTPKIRIADLFLSQDDRNPKIYKMIEKSRFYYINGLRDLFVQIDMVLIFHFRPGIPRKCLYNSPENHPRVWDDFLENSGMIFQAFIKTFPGNSWTK